MHAPSFWWRKGAALGWALAPAGWLYGWFTARRMRQLGEAAPCPILCVGNFTLGGSGKTPLALALGRLAIEKGYKPGYLSRGYGGSTKGPIEVEPGRHSADEVGDEPLLLASVATTVVARDRVAGARLLAEKGANLVIMDDGFQNPSLTKTVSLVVVDGARGTGNGFVFPAGPLRAPMSSQLPFTDGVFVMGEGEPGDALAARAGAQGLPVFRGVLRPRGRGEWQNERCLAFAGIGAPERFFRSLEDVGAVVAARHRFADHHPYSEEDCRRLVAEAERAGLKLVTTEKDAARLTGRGGARQALYERLTVFPVEADIPEREALWNWLTERLF
ncbi:tetraacyldisaccharide 4'-kinase [Afifella marina]|uniref:Tetraacyldisaccharide 4'-kinase n=1 Tax=Afifella marina DSM 2698 TaxID=1120955 RepID=A0A1G5MBM0_AFIMA|nr:tetraacyldisaccharide 4'-kinase [Afifella marina]MBK1622770.1 tetraacyldisaccharide 4'-kinase [Afifella marina DSM 2698]MBK1625765.1 tetraacyldisaccharide 4'-kinase [Afifella marina]MBK5917588.1 tetraacyldisaccharide 4'-kinase [Afifella marina]RAI23518.1 tetraacyldisaccharide 4'-kinase [Afifella marina DSM 2698]SCZ21779.1 lipid-A-disaccharide kinase [Afifella marina DSM 2698]